MSTSRSDSVTSVDRDDLRDEAWALLQEIAVEPGRPEPAGRYIEVTLDADLWARVQDWDGRRYDHVDGHA